MRCVAPDAAAVHALDAHRGFDLPVVVLEVLLLEGPRACGALLLDLHGKSRSSSGLGTFSRVQDVLGRCFGCF